MAYKKMGYNEAIKIKRRLKITLLFIGNLETIGNEKVPLFCNSMNK